MPQTMNSDREEALTRLRQWLKPGDTVHTLLRAVSGSRMSRTVDALRLVPSEDGNVRIINLGPSAAQALGLKYDNERDGVRMSGVGEDKGFRLVYELGELLFGDGYALTQKWL